MSAITITLSLEQFGNLLPHLPAGLPVKVSAGPSTMPPVPATIRPPLAVPGWLDLAGRIRTLKTGENCSFRPDEWGDSPDLARAARRVYSAAHNLAGRLGTSPVFRVRLNRDEGVVYVYRIA